MAQLPLPVNLPQRAHKKIDKDKSQKKAEWAPYLVTASVTWAPGRTLSAETVRLGKAN
jgi:hypothetical protein